MKLGKIGIVLFAICLCISSFIVSAILASDSTIKADTTKAIKVVEILNTPDTIKSEFTNDTITIPNPTPVGQVMNNLSDQLTDVQKKDKIRNLLQKWRHKGWIANETRGKISSWWLTIET